MLGDLQTAFTLLVTGMVTVFVALGIVVLTGQLLISLVNKLVPEEKAGIPISQNRISSSAVPGKRKLAIVTAAAHVATKGKGKVVGIERLKK